MTVEFVLFKSNCQNCWYIYPTGITSPTLALPRPNEMDVHECLSSGRKICGSHKGKDLGCKEDVEVFPSHISEAYPSPVWQHGNGSYHAKGWFRPTAFQGGFVFMAGRSTLSHQETNHTSLLFFACLHFQSWTNTLHYAHPESNEETIVWTCAFSLCMSPTLQMAVTLRDNSVASFSEECVLWRVFNIHLTAPYRSIGL